VVDGAGVLCKWADEDVVDVGADVGADANSTTGDEGAGLEVMAEGTPGEDGRGAGSLAVEGSDMGSAGEEEEDEADGVERGGAGGGGGGNRISHGCRWATWDERNASAGGG